MHYFRLDTAGNVTEIATSLTAEQHTDRSWVYRGDFNTVFDAENVARGATALTGEQWVATDSGRYVSPRYDVIRAPHVGDEVSYAFNGDYYPDGVVTKVSAFDKGLKVVTTSTGSRYYRRGVTGKWIKQGGTWALVRGHIRQSNPEF